MPVIIPAAVGGNQDLFIEPMDPRFFTATSAYSGASTAYLLKFRLSKATTATSLTYSVGAASGNVDLGIFTSTDNLNFTLLGSSGSTASAGTNANQTIALTANVNLVPGVNYWAAISSDNTTLTVAQISNASAVSVLSKAVLSKASLFPLATFVTPSAPGRAPYVAVTTTG